MVSKPKNNNGGGDNQPAATTALAVTRRTARTLQKDSNGNTKVLEKEVDCIDLTLPGASFIPDKFEDGAIFRYQTDRQQMVEITLTEIAYLNRGNNPLAIQDYRIFVNECITYRLNPYTDLYLIKMQADQPAQIVIKADTFLRRAAEWPGYLGYETGWIVAPPGAGKGQKCLEPRAEIPPGLNIIGAWAQAYREGHKTPTFEALLTSYEKKSQSGRSRWEKDPQGMIAKVSRAAAHRLAFPEALGGMYSEDEMIEAQQPINGNGKQLPESVSPPLPDNPTISQIRERLGDEWADRFKQSPAAPQPTAPQPTQSPEPESESDEDLFADQSPLSDLKQEQEAIKEPQPQPTKANAAIW